MTADRSLPILMVADYQTTVCIVTNLLRQIGHANIDVAASAAAARCRLRGKSYALVIADSALARSTGGDVVAEIRADARFERMPVLVLAPQSQAALLDAATASDGYLFMPFNAATLRSRIGAVLAPPPITGARLTSPAGASPPSG